jgi:hypothetical protein
MFLAFLYTWGYLMLYIITGGLGGGRTTKDSWPPLLRHTRAVRFSRDSFRLSTGRAREATLPHRALLAALQPRHLSHRRRPSLRPRPPQSPLRHRPHLPVETHQTAERSRHLDREHHSNGANPRLFIFETLK